MQKYNGNNHHDNEIIVDFKEKRVDFNKVDDVNILTVFTLTYINITFGCVLLYPLFVVFGLSGLLTVIIVSSTIFIITSIITFVPKIRYYVYPRLNAFMAKIETRHFKLIPGMIDEEFKSVYIVSGFKNIFLEYEVDGEFAECLEKIEIKAIDKWRYPKRPKQWYAVFKFSKLPLSGSLNIRYR